MPLIKLLQESKVKFIFADIPELNDSTIHILAAIAQYEHERISKRVKKALAAAKAKGKKLGNPKLMVRNSMTKMQSEQFANELKPILYNSRKEV